LAVKLFAVAVRAHDRGRGIGVDGQTPRLKILAGESGRVPLGNRDDIEQPVSKPRSSRYLTLRIVGGRAA
jgi:hypothetical protein